MKTNTITIAGILLFAFFAGACKKNKGDYASGQVVMHLTDAPVQRAASDYEQINLDVQKVRLRVAGSTGGDWIDIQTRPGIYDMARFESGADTILGKADIPQGETMQVKLVLGTNNTVKVNGQLYPMIIPTGGDTGLTREVYKVISSETPLHLSIGFDIEHSITQDGNAYTMRPVIRVPQ